jgi:hypothetical protein
MNKIFSNFIVRDIKYYFGFLFDKGYRIRETIYNWLGGYWNVVLESTNCLVHIHSDHGEIFLAFSPLNTELESLIGIRPMIYFLSQGQIFVDSYKGNFSQEKKGQFERLASLTKEHIDEITPYFGDDFEKYKKDLILAQKKYNDLLLKNYTRPR